MASMNNLLISWNFDTVQESNSTGEFTVKDVANGYYGTGHGFTQNSNKIVLKEEIITNKKVHIDNLEASQTIQTLDEDDLRVDKYNKPAKVQLMIENSMYQIISDEMLNMFSTIDAYAFKFIEPYHKYRYEYDKLIASRNEFFSKILEKPNLEKYIEFYKWLDSSLGYMLNQLIPENSSNSNGLKTTIESHILERNKYKHQIPLTVSSNRVFTSGIEVIKNISGSNHTNFSSSIEDIINIENIYNKNFFNQYEVIQSAGRAINDRGEENNKTIFRTVFSSVDGKSDIYKDSSKEYSVYNDLNQKSLLERQKFNVSESLATPFASKNVVNGLLYGNQGETGTSSFRDNNFISRNVPYTASNYHTDKEYLDGLGSNVNYKNIPDKLVEFYRYDNILTDRNRFTYATSEDIVEPPIEFNLPVKQDLLVNTGLEPITVYYPYSNMLDMFSFRNLRAHYRFFRVFVFNLKFLSDKDTFWRVLQNTSGSHTPLYLEKFDIIYPRTDLIGLARARYRSRFEEEQGWKQRNFSTTVDRNPNYYLDDRFIEPWSYNSFNINSSRNRMYWRDSEQKRRRTRGIDPENPENFLYDPAYTGSYNCLNYPNRSESLVDLSTKEPIEEYDWRAFYQGNPYNSLYAMDCQVSYSFGCHPGTSEEDTGFAFLSCSFEQYGDISPYSHFYIHKLLTTGSDEHKQYNQPKPLFVHNLYIDPITGTIDPVSNPFYTDLSDPAYLPSAGNSTVGAYFLNYGIRPFKPDPDSTVPTASFPAPTPDPNTYKESIYIVNRSYQVGLDCRIRPWYDDYEEFSANIKHKSQTMSIVPEFIVGNFPQLLDGDNEYAALYSASHTVDPTTGRRWWPKRGTEVPRYLTINGHERYDQIRYADFYSDLKNFIDPKTNKLKINLNVVKKVLPYNGFYPQQRTAQIAGAFSNEYLERTGLVQAFSKNITEKKAQFINNSRTLALMQPFFMPGILFNSIKSGIAVSWPTTPIKSTKEVVDDQALHNMPLGLWPAVYNSGSIVGEDIHVTRLTYKMPFESILRPHNSYLEMYKYMQQNYGLWEDSSYMNPNIKSNYTYFDLEDFPNADVMLPYLEPSHYSKNINFLGSRRYLVKTSLGTVLEKMNKESYLYTSMIHNFLNETVNFFLEDQELTTFRSAPISEFGDVVEGLVYSMDVILKKSPNFSMFNRYSITEGNYIPSASLFGPPVQNLSNVDDEGFINSSLNTAYHPFTPPYFRSGSQDSLTIIYTASYSGKPTFSELIQNSKIVWKDMGDTNGTEASTKKMLLKDCLRTNIFELIQGPEFDPKTGKSITPYADLLTDENKRWCIKTKFETPLLDFNKCSDIYSGTVGQWEEQWGYFYNRH